tara:strand:+ start:1871 stop:2575 length:705 start_codon:yes stop_codon:yes gene_type:complete
MAIFKMGAIVTEIVGSIGGTNFRRGVNNGIISNKSYGGTKNKLLQNPQLGAIASIFKQWRALDPELQGYWNAEALNFLFPDKFGVQKNLTGRQLFSKMNVQLLVVNESIADPTGMSSDVATFDPGPGLVVPQYNGASFRVDDISIPSRFLISCEIAHGPLNAPTFTRRATIKEVYVGGTYWEEEFGNEFFATFPYYTYGYEARFYIEAINEWGFKSVPNFISPVTLPYIIPPEE